MNIRTSEVHRLCGACGCSHRIALHEWMDLSRSRKQVDEREINDKRKMCEFGWPFRMLVIVYGCIMLYIHNTRAYTRTSI